MIGFWFLGNLGGLDNRADIFFDRAGDNPVGLIVGTLDAPTAIGFADRPVHRRGDLISIHNHMAFEVTGGPANRLNQGGFRPQEPFLIGIQNCHQTNLRQVKPFPEQVDANQHIKCP